jgi:hypothetical protein
MYVLPPAGGPRPEPEPEPVIIFRMSKPFDPAALTRKVREVLDDPL